MADDPIASSSSPMPKEDPEELVLRGRPRPPVRFKRGLIIGLAGAGAALLIGVSWLALEPPSFEAVAAEERGDPAGRGPADTLAAMPKSYGEVPQLGPPLPGDLGRPILEKQRQLAAPIQPASEAPAMLEQARATEAERQRLAADEQSARSSSVLVQLGQQRQPAPASPLPVAEPADRPEPEPGAQQPGQNRKLAFTGGSSSDRNPHALAPAPGRWVLSAGSIIPASLITGLNSDLPGTVLAQVTEPVRDSARGEAVLIPQGARLIGRYDSMVAFGQRRALLVWERIIFPDGSSLRIDNMPATDLAGYAGIEDKVDFHSWRLLTGIAMASLLGVGSELSFGASEGGLVKALRESAQDNASRAGDQLTRRNLDVQPTLRVRPGWPVRAIVHKDLVLPPWKG